MLKDLLDVDYCLNNNVTNLVAKIVNDCIDRKRWQMVPRKVCVNIMAGKRIIRPCRWIQAAILSIAGTIMPQGMLYVAVCN